MKSLFTILAIIFITSLSWGQPLKLSIDIISIDELKDGDTLSDYLYIGKYPQMISSFQMYILFDQEVLKYDETKYGINTKSQTKFLNSNYEHIDLVLVDGCLCKL